MCNLSLKGLGLNRERSLIELLRYLAFAESQCFKIFLVFSLRLFLKHSCISKV